MVYPGVCQSEITRGVSVIDPGGRFVVDPDPGCVAVIDPGVSPIMILL